MQILEEKYKQQVVPILKKELGLKNSMAAPKITKVIISIGLKEAAHDEGVLKKASDRLMVIAGQKPKVCRAKKSISNFKLAIGDPIGLMVTLRGRRMYDFLAKLFYIVLPRVRDFRGVSPKSFDGKGNYSLGIEEQIVFSEIEFDKSEKAKGLEITIVTNAKSDEDARKLLEFTGMPFAKVLGKPTVQEKK